MYLWVPVGVEDDDGVCALKVKPLPSCPGAKHKHPVLALLVVERVHHLAAVLRVAVQAEVCEPLALEEVLQ